MAHHDSLQRLVDAHTKTVTFLEEASRCTTSHSSFFCLFLVLWPIALCQCESLLTRRSSPRATPPPRVSPKGTEPVMKPNAALPLRPRTRRSRDTSTRALRASRSTQAPRKGLISGSTLTCLGRRLTVGRAVPVCRRHTSDGHSIGLFCATEGRRCGLRQRHRLVAVAPPPDRTVWGEASPLRDGRPTSSLRASPSTARLRRPGGPWPPRRESGPAAAPVHPQSPQFGHGGPA